MVYPVPDPALPFLGVHITRHIDGGVLLGPTALLVAARDGYGGRPASRPPLESALRDARQTLSWPGTWALARTFWRTGLTEMAMASSRTLFVAKCAKYVPAIGSMRLEPRGMRGIRAQAVSRDGRLVDDFVISHTPGVTHLRNAPSPAATSAFALAARIVDRLEAASG
jgi:L-2-hydroxyglutarate oxidase LhgO